MQLRIPTTHFRLEGHLKVGFLPMEKKKEDGDVRDEILQWLQLERERRRCMHFLKILVTISSNIKWLGEKDGYQWTV